MKLSSLAILSIVLVSGAYSADQKNKKDDPNQIGDRDVGKCLNFYSLDKEIAWGKQLADEVARESKIDDDPILSEYVNRVGQNLARNSDAKVPFTFRVIDGEELNAFALPGGYVFVYTGLIKLASEEDEFAGALAHEIAHVAARHMTCRASQEQIAKTAGVLPGILLGPLGGWAARQAAGVAIPMTFRSFSRHDEAEADYLGVQYMYKAGYDPQSFVSFFEKVKAQEKKKPGTLAKAFSSHPPTPDRILKTQEEIRTVLPARPEYIVNTSEFNEVKARLAALQNRKKGIEEKDNSKPSLRRTQTADNKGKDGKDGDDRPTLQRRDDDFIASTGQR